jgi:hypothetical protein
MKRKYEFPGKGGNMANWEANSLSQKQRRCGGLICCKDFSMQGQMKRKYEFPEKKGEYGRLRCEQVTAKSKKDLED